ncbi:MAG: CBS domain-containing protein [Desulfobacterota bacterium]|nr:CBS domain-containing protein [Thermodesulfobacteriota bacterium]
MEVITTHLNADFDSLGSMLAAKKLYPEAVLVFPGSQEKNLRDFFIHSTFYALEVERIKQIDLEQVHRLILVDTRQVSRIGKFSEILSKPGLEIHIYDHHPPSAEDIRGSLEVIEEVGANVTLLLKLLRAKGIPITSEEATLMLLGIYEDTGNLTFPSTKEEDFIAAGYLVRQGADLNILSNVITKELTAEQVFLLNDLMEAATRYDIHGIDVVISQASVERYVGDIAVLVHKLMDMENLNVLFALVQMEGRIYLIGRSRIEEVNVSEIASEFGGGGHPSAASATIKGMSLIEAQSRLLTILREAVRPRKLARDLMVYPVKTVDPEQTLEEAAEVLSRYLLDALPVYREGKVLGLITKDVVERAIRHGLKEGLVRDYMVTEFSTLTPEEPFSKIQELAFAQNQNLIPIVQEDRLVGVISLAEVMRTLQEGMARSGRDHQPLYARKRMIPKLIEERFPERIRNLLVEFGRVGEELGYSVFGVGGFVRDLLMRVENFDIDIVVEGDGIRLAEEFGKRFPCRIRTHKKFGTALVLFPDGLKVDVATARLEVYESPAALPTVERGSIKADLYRRDFTINALAVHLNPRSFGELIDFFGGVKDIKERIIRVLHNLSFIEDPTRAFRAIRFEQRFKFQISKHTQQLMRNAVKMRIFDRLSGGRILSEFLLLCQEENPLPAFRRMKDFNLFPVFHPKLQVGEETFVLFDQIHHVLSWFDLLFLDEKYERWLIYLYGLVDGLTEAEASELCERLGMNARLKDRVMEGKRQAHLTLSTFYSWINAGKEPKRSEIYTLLHPLPTEVKLFMMAKTSQVATRRYLSLYFTQLKDTRPLLKGADLVQMGLKPGPIIRKRLEDLLKARLDELVVTRQDEVQFVNRLTGMG